VHDLQEIKRATGDALFQTQDRLAVASRPLRRRVHLLTRFARLDPNFLIIGTAKGGTTSLYECLVEHPAVGRSFEKEPRYFDANYQRGASWYRSHFPLTTFRRSVRRRYGVDPGVFEATPYYLLHPLVPARVRRDYPSMRLIAVLRDPVARAYSHYSHQVRMGHESRTFAEAIACEEELLAPELERMLADESYDSRPYRLFSYVTRGLYLDQLERWLRVFPREQLLVLASEDLFERPAETLPAVLRFLGLPPRPGLTLPHERRGGYDPVIPDDAAERLAVVYEEPNRRLYEFLGRDLGWTRPAAARAAPAARAGSS
jgi:hypothetical protein